MFLLGFRSILEENWKDLCSAGIFFGNNVSTFSIHTIVHSRVEVLSYDEPYIFMGKST